MRGAAQYFAMARERYTMFLKRQAGEKAPWTKDYILRNYRFCNVFREDDAVTKWFAEHVRGPMSDEPEVVFAAYSFRFFNTVRTGERMLENNLFRDWNGERAMRCLADLKPLVTAAYMIKSPIGMKKLPGLVEVMNIGWGARHEIYDHMRSTRSLEQSHKKLCGYYYVGPFMAYEFVTDLRHTHVLSDAMDIMTWANPGPGASRGLSRVLYENVKRTVSSAEMLDGMRQLLELSRDPLYWPAEWPQWEMREVEHVLCEWDKYERCRLGEGTPKQRYDGGR